MVNVMRRADFSVYPMPFALCRRLALFLLPFSIFLTTGCSSSPHARLTVRPSNDPNQAYSQAFEQAFVARSAEGEYQAILIDDGPRGAQAAVKPGARLKSAPASPVKQILHMRVFWRPLSGTHADHPSATNAALDWYVLGDGADRSRNFLHYSGAGFVTASNTRDGAKFHIRSAGLILKEQRGQMSDPIGPARITGTILAVTDEPIVRSQTQEIQALLTDTASSSQASITNAPPPRSHDEP